MEKKYSIFLSTCDAYSDCWDPFFFLFKKYWPDYDGTIYMVTDSKTYNYEGLDIKCLNINTIKGIKDGMNLSWGKRMRWGMELIDSDIFLFMQEDFFIRGKVQDYIIDSYVNIMLKDPSIKCIHIARPCIRVESKSEYEHLYNMKLKQKYRVSCQPALWRKDEFYNVMNDEDSPWQLEVYGSRRSAKMNHRYLIVDRNWLRNDKFEIIPYVFTGISKGKWKKEVVSVFKDNGIEIDYSIRGFYEMGNKWNRFLRGLEWRKELYKREFKQKIGIGKSQF